MTSLPGTDEADVDEEEERQENQPETGMEFISEFPPKGFPPRKPPKRKPRKQAPPTEGAHTTPPAPEEALKSDVSPSVSVEERKKPPASVSMEERKKLSTSEVRFKVDSLTEIKARMTQPISEPSVPSVSGAQASNVETANTGGVLSLRSGSGDETSLQSQAAKLEEKFRGLSSPPPEQLPTGQIVFSRDPRVAKRQQQLLQQVSVGDPEEKAEEVIPPWKEESCSGVSFLSLPSPYSFRKLSARMFLCDANGVELPLKLFLTGSLFSFSLSPPSLSSLSPSARRKPLRQQRTDKTTVEKRTRLG